MNIYSTFQQQYPLSSRKFWKKMCGDFIGVAVFLGFLLVAVILISNAANSGGSASGAPQVRVFYWAGLFIFPLALYLAIKIFYTKAYIKRYYYDCSESFITIKKNVFTPTEIHVQYQKIQDVYVDQDLLDRMMGLYDVHIASATISSGIEAHIDGVNQQVAEGIKNFLLDKIKTGGGPVATGSNPEKRNQDASDSDVSQVKFDHPVSSTEYPIQGRWLVSMAVSSFVSSLIYLLVVLCVFSKLTIPAGATAYGLLYIGLSILNFIWKILWKNSYRFEFTPEYILLRDGVLSKEVRHLPYKSIQNISFSQGIVDRLLGIGSVSIENAAVQTLSGGQNSKNLALSQGVFIPGQSVEKANELLAILNGIINKKANPAGMGL